MFVHSIDEIPALCISMIKKTQTCNMETFYGLLTSICDETNHCLSLGHLESLQTISQFIDIDII